jgi:hypothetical protein
MRKLFFVLVVLCFSNVVLSQSNVGIGTTNPDASALLDLNSNNKGVLFPRLFLTNINLPTPVSAPTTGLLIWNTNADLTGGNGIGFYFWNVTKWEKLTGSSTNLWIPDANGMHSSVAHVGIGLNSHYAFPLHVRQPSFGGNGGSIAYFESDDSWMGSIAIKNNLSGAQYTFAVGGPTNTEFGTNNFALFNHVALKHSLNITGTNNYVGIGGSPGPNTIPLLPKSRLHVFFGDVNIDQIGSGIIMKSPNGNCWRVTLDNDGNLIRTPITCP